MANADTERLMYEPLTRAAERTGMTVQELRRCIGAGRINAYRFGSRIIRVDPREVDMLWAATLLDSTLLMLSGLANRRLVNDVPVSSGPDPTAIMASCPSSRAAP